MIGKFAGIALRASRVSPAALRLLAVLLLALAGLTATAPPRAAAAGGTTLFSQTFANNTATGVSKPSAPSGTNYACLTASGNSSTAPLLSCPSTNDANGSGKLRLTAASTGLEGGVFSATSVPTSQGLDATFNSYQYGGNGADGIAFVLAAVDPSNPVVPSSIGQPGGSLGYSANGLTSGLSYGYMGIGLDVYGNFSNSSFQGSGCTNPAYISTLSTVPGQVVVRGPGNGTVGYCAVNSSATSTSSKALTLRASTRAASVVPVEVGINPTAAAITFASGLTVAAGGYKVQFTPVGGSATTLSGTLPTVASNLYPSTYLNSSGIPKQLAFGWVGSTGGSNDFHEIDSVSVVSANPVPQLAVSATSYSAATPGAGGPVTYTVSPGVASGGTSETNPVSVSLTAPSGVTPKAATGSGWTCASPVGQVITCTYSTTPVAAGTSLPAITVDAISTSATLTSAAIASGTTVTASSSDGAPATANPTAGTVPTAPSGLSLSPNSGSTGGGNAVTISGTNISGATAVYVGTAAQQAAGTSTVLVPCATGQTSGCFTVNGNGTITIPSMPSAAAVGTDNVTVVTNGVGASATYTYTAVPGTPAAPTATAGITSATVTWTAPASNGLPISGYVVTPYLNGVAQTPVTYNSTATTQTLTGLTAGASYTFTVAAVNSLGTGQASAQSNTVVPYTLPGAPTGVTASAGDSAATVTWTAPASNGGSAVTGYVVTPYVNGVAQTPQTFSSAATTETVSGLTPGTSYTFKVAAVNAAGTGPASSSSNSVTVNTGPSITSSAPPGGEAGVGYSSQLTAAGGTGAYTWSVSSGSLPGGLTLNASTGLLSGTPTTGGSYTFTVLVTDAFGGTASKSYTVTIAAAPSLANATPPSGQAGVAYSDTLTVAGGTSPVTWSVSSGSLPAGLTLNASTGVISGTPTTPGVSTFTVTVTDANGKTASQTLNLTVTAGPLVISASAGASTVAQGGKLTYTVTISNTGTTTFSGVNYSVPLSDVLDDAAYDNDAAATAGSVSFASQALSWTGSLAAGATATVTFSVTVNNPDTGNGMLSFTVVSPTTGTNCPSASTDTRCGVSVPVWALTITQTATPASAAPGGTVRYTVTVTNSGQLAYTGATFTDALSGILDDAAYNGDAAATAGTVSYTNPNLTWTGNLAVGASATITFSATVNNPDTGDKILLSTVTSATGGANCATGSSDTRCSARVGVQGLTISSSASTASATPGSTVQYTVTVTNSGQAAYTGATFTDALTGLLDDAVYNGDAAASAGSLSYTSPNLSWTGNLAVGAAATITFTATVNNPDTGDKSLTTQITSATAASNCPSGGTNAACATTVSVLVPALSIILAASPASSTTPGSTVQYTLTVKDTGQTSYTGISAAVSLTGVLDDAAYNSDATATSGSVAYSSPNLTWTGSLSPGGTATVTFSVTVNSPDAGDLSLGATVTSAATGSNCASGSTDTNCSSTVKVLVPGLTLAVTSSGSSTTAGSKVTYTVTVTNTGQTTQSGISFTDALAGVLDDAAYDSDVSATAGSATFSSPNLTWTGTLAPGAAATVTFSVTVNNPDTGNKILASTLTSAATGSNCAPGSSDSRCTSAVTVSSLAITNTASGSTTTPGSTVRYTATFTNTGQTRYTGITVSSDASDVFDDASPNGDQTATSGTLTLTASGISWTGSIPVGGTVTVTGTVTVNNPDTGNKLMTSSLTTTAAGSNCAAGSTDPACSAAVTVLVPGLTITNTAGASTTTPGSAVGYTVTIADTGQTSYSGISVADDLTGLLSDAAYNGNAAASAGSVSYASPVLTWTGSLTPGQTVTVTFTATVNSPDNGSKSMVAVAYSAAAGSSCPSADTTAAGCRSVVTVLTPALSITSTANKTTAQPGDTVSYTVKIADTGQTPYTGITVTDDLTGLLDDAAYNGDVAATAGTATFTSPKISWTGSLAVGASVTVTFTATVANPDTGDRTLSTTAVSAAAGSNCAAGSTDANCATSVSVQNAATLTITVASDVASAVAGGVVHYTVTVANAGATPYLGASFTDALAGVLDDASYNGDVAASTGTAALSGQNLTWSGDVPATGAATITFSVTVNRPDTGNMILASTLSSVALGSNCASGSSDTRCASTVTVSALRIVNTVTPASVSPGGVVRYTATFTNTGQTPYFDITVATDASDVFDDASPDGDQTATSGTLALTSSGISWTGSIPVGATVTSTGTATVNSPDTGNKLLTSTLSTSAAGSNCPPGSTDSACTATATVLIPGLTITNTASTSTTTPGSAVGYTVTIANTGQTAYSGISVADDLSGLLNDATYDNDAAATSGSVAFASPVLTWTGSLNPGQTATVSFSVTVNNPDTGDKTMVAVAYSSAAGSSCPSAATTAAGCRSIVTDLTPGLTITNTAGSATTTPGAAVSYTVKIADTGQTPYSGITVTDDLTGLLDDAAYNGDAAATAGTVSYASPKLTWTGSLVPGNLVTVTFTATVGNPDAGDKMLGTAASSAAAGSNCTSGSTRSSCVNQVPVAVLSIVNTASVSTVTPGGTVGYTVTVTNSGQTQVTNGTFVIPLNDVLDDAAYNGDAAATAGTVTYSSPALTWTGTLAPGAGATITYSATVSSPDTGNKLLRDTITSSTPGSTCPASGAAPAACSASVTVLVPGLTITTTASSSTTTPGSTVQYTVTVTDTGQTSYSGITVVSSLANALNDGVYDNDAAATAGTVSYASWQVTWTGSLNPGDSAVITYSITVSNPDNGDKKLVTTVVSSAPGSTCPPGNANAACSTTVTDLIPGLTVSTTGTPASATPGSTVTYTVTVNNTGQTSYAGLTVTDDLTALLGEAAYNGDAAATSGTVTYTRPKLTWTGSLSPGDSAVITYSVTISNPETGGTSMTSTVGADVAGSNCPTGSPNSACSVTTGIIAGPLSITAPASASLGSGAPGSVISGQLGPVQVQDLRGFGANWTAAVSSSNFTTGGGSASETIPVGALSYGISTFTSTTGAATFGHASQVQLSPNPQSVVTATNVNGNTTVTWNPLVTVNVPGGAVSGSYSGTIVHSVS